ncbi:uncharacterized protein BDW70DRAFT_126025 [Aspergillus foveolatus]|uniref:uncharacterized protein n=1 Tax=Aspergillus foveolatus TaxID=210207 RepID=UPI003CCDA671
MSSHHIRLTWVRTPARPSLFVMPCIMVLVYHLYFVSPAGQVALNTQQIITPSL